MAFSVPNEASASYTDQAEIDSIDLKILSKLGMGSGLLTGGVVTAQSTPDDTVAVSGGTARIGGNSVTISAGNVNVLSGSANPDSSTSSAADANYFRYDLIVVDTSNHLGVIHGTVPTPAWPDYSVNPVFPDFSAQQLPLAAILVPPTAAAITGIASSQIVAKAPDISVNAYHDQAHSIVSATSHASGWGGKGYLPVGTATTTSTTLAPGTNGQMLTAQSAQTSGLQYADVWTVANFAKAGAQVTGAGTYRWYNDTGRTLTFANVRISLGTAPTGTTSTPITGATFVVDVNKAGTSIWASTQANRATIIPGTDANTGLFTTFDTTTIATGSYLTVDVDFIGSTIAGSDLVVQIWMKN